METKRRADWVVPFVIAATGFLISAFNAYHNNDKELAQKIAIIETKQGDDRAVLHDVQEKVNRIYDKVAKW